MTAIDVEAFRQRLLDERQRVADAIENLHHENPGSLADETDEPLFQDNHPGDVATVTFEREMAETLEENSTQVIVAIDAALGRLDDGTYGLCERCGSPIAPERLDVRPWATLCIECKRKEERG
jgi:RNA polymerase-binding protein DksA